MALKLYRRYRTEVKAGTPKTASLDRLKTKIRELWNARRNRTSNKLRDESNAYLRGWWEDFRLAEVRSPVKRVGEIGPPTYPEMLLVVMA